MKSEADDRWEICRVLDGYAEALDRRDWDALESVFTEDLVFDFGEWVTKSRAAAVKSIRSYLDGCGPTQHLLGNYRIDLDGDQAASRFYVRAFHIGIGNAEGETYEMAGEYSDRLRLTPDGWRSFSRQGRVQWEIGSRSVLGPG